MGDGAVLHRNLNLTNWKQKIHCESSNIVENWRILGLFFAFLLPRTNPHKQHLLGFRTSSHYNSLSMHSFALKVLVSQIECCK